MSSDQLDFEIKETDTVFLAQYFDGIELYLGVFGLTPAEQADVKKMAHVHDTQTAMGKCLALWRKHNPSKATLKELLIILLSLRKEEIASHVCNCFYPKPKVQ